MAAGSIGRRGLILAVAASLVAVPGASAQNPLEMDPYLQGRCPSDPGRGFQINFNPDINAWPVYEHTECSPTYAGEPAPAPASGPARTRSTTPARPAEPATQVRRKAKRARCAKRLKRARWGCARKARRR